VQFAAIRPAREPEGTSGLSEERIALWRVQPEREELEEKYLEAEFARARARERERERERDSSSEGARRALTFASFSRFSQRRCSIERLASFGSSRRCSESRRRGTLSRVNVNATGENSTAHSASRARAKQLRSRLAPALTANSATNPEGTSLVLRR